MNPALLSAASRALEKAGANPPSAAFWVPGRIEVLGKHTDYAGGRSLVCAVEHGFVAVTAPRADEAVRVLNVADGSQAVFPFRGDLSEPTHGWSRYPATVIGRVARNFPNARRGADLAFASDLPAASGMSSSSAFMVAVFLGLARVNELELDAQYCSAIRTREDLAAYLATMENGESFGAFAGESGVGTFGGSEDHTAMLCGRPGELSQYAFCPVRHERQVPCPPDHRFVVAVSGVTAEKTGAAMAGYNRIALAARAILDAWRAASGGSDRSLAEAVERHGARAVRDVIERTRVATFDVQVLLDRFDQFIEESMHIVPSAGGALASGDLEAFGRLVDRSHDLAVRLLRNQVPETEWLARSARDLGALAASAFGAGFGGSVWALVPRGATEWFGRRWEEAYRKAFPTRAPLLLATGAGPAAGAIEPPPANSAAWLK